MKHLLAAAALLISTSVGAGPVFQFQANKRAELLDDLTLEMSAPRATFVLHPDGHPVFPFPHIDEIKGLVSVGLFGGQAFTNLLGDDGIGIPPSDSFRLP